MGWLDAVGGFVKGAGEGAWDSVKGTVSGVAHLAEDGYKVATDGQYRAQVWNSALNDAKAATNFATTAVTDPGKAADEIGNIASHAWHARSAEADQRVFDDDSMGRFDRYLETYKAERGRA